MSGCVILRNQSLNRVTIQRFQQAKYFCVAGGGNTQFKSIQLRHLVLSRNVVQILFALLVRHFGVKLNRKYKRNTNDICRF
jgi:hypothetical protein